ncbi:hypothetical protein Plec18170_003960 [Paecilomyces lecythidis]
MFKRKPILAGNSDLNQAHLIFNLVGTPTEENMPGWSSLPGCEGVRNFGSKPGNLSQVFKDQGPVAISLLTELLKLDWRKRINAIDALKHPYFETPPLPAKPGELPQFEDSHELDRRKFRGQRAAPPPAPAGGSAGIGSNPEWAMKSAGRPPPDTRGGRIPGVARPGYANAPQRRPGDARSSDSQAKPGFDDGHQHLPAWHRDRLPPKPPVSAHHAAWSGRRDRPPQGHGGGRPDSRVDSYVPRYDGSRDRSRSRDVDTLRRRSRSPTSRDRGREADQSYNVYRR